jgi:hypothetical protein
MIPVAPCNCTSKNRSETRTRSPMENPADGMTHTLIVPRRSKAEVALVHLRRIPQWTKPRPRLASSVARRVVQFLPSERKRKARVEKLTERPCRTEGQCR